VTRVRAWRRSGRFHHSEFPPERLVKGWSAGVSICLPARDEARTVGAILEQLIPLRELGVVDQIVVVDNSTDDTGEIARRLGAEVHDHADLLPELGPLAGKGDAMWRALSVLTGEIVCFLDADSESFGAHFACGLVGPLLERSDISFVKGYYRRPFRVGSTTYPEGGGRVTELTARPLINLFYPDLAGIEQPLAGEVAARRELFERLPFASGYGVDIGLLLDAYAAVGLDGIAQVDLEVRQNAHQPLRDLGPMAAEVLGAVAVRLEREGRLRGDLAGAQQLERPPHVSLGAAA
jgi:glucosyl-3-phosphoglycerate synthase